MKISCDLHIAAIVVCTQDEEYIIIVLRGHKDKPRMPNKAVEFAYFLLNFDPSKRSISSR